MSDPICEGIKMNKNVLKTYILSKAAAMLLAVTLSLSLLVPASCINTYAVTDAATAAEAETGHPAATSITDCKAFYNQFLDRDLIIEADISPAGGREVQLQRYNSKDSSWETIITVNADEDTRSEEAAEVSRTAEPVTDADGEAGAAAETAHVSISVPKEEREKTSSTWRFFVPATETASEAVSGKISVTTRNLEKLDLSARAACIYRIDSKSNGTTIYSMNGNDEVAQASTTKLMTAILLLESGLIDSTTRISSHAAATPWGSGRLAAGDVYSNRDLLYAMLLPSSNDAATAIAERVGGSEAAFVGMMNDKAGKMGFTRTHFRNPHGLDADGHYTTARELAKLTAYAYNFPEIRDCWATQCKTITSLERKRSWTLWSTNAIFNYVKNFLGGKTGTESNAGCCFTGIYTYGGSTYVTVVLGSGYGFSRWSDTKKLHRYIQDHAATGY